MEKEEQVQTISENMSLEMSVIPVFTPLDKTRLYREVKRLAALTVSNTDAIDYFKQRHRPHPFLLLSRPCLGSHYITEGFQRKLFVKTWERLIQPDRSRAVTQSLGQCVFL